MKKLSEIELIEATAHAIKEKRDNPPNRFPFKKGAILPNGMTLLGTHYTYGVAIPSRMVQYSRLAWRFYLVKWNAAKKEVELIEELKLTDSRNFFRAEVTLPISQTIAETVGQKIKHVKLVQACKRILCKYARASSKIQYVIQSSDARHSSNEKIGLKKDGTWGLFVAPTLFKFENLVHARIHARWLAENYPNHEYVRAMAIHSFDTDKTYPALGHEKQIDLILKLIGGYEGDFNFTKESKRLAKVNAELDAKHYPNQTTPTNDDDNFGGLL